MLILWQYKKKYKIILCDIFATGVVYLQFRIVLMFIGLNKFCFVMFLFQFIERKFFLCDKTNDSITDLSIENKTLTL